MNLTDRKKVVVKKEMTLVEKLYIPAITNGMVITLKHFFKKGATVRYPCPAEAITMESAERKKGEENLYREEKYATIYEINMLRCIFCGLCEEACPKEAIFLTDRIVPVSGNRKGMVYGKDKLVEDINHPIDLSYRQTKAVAEFKKDKTKAHNQTWKDKQNLIKEKNH